MADLPPNILLTVDNVQQLGVRKIQLTYLVFRLLEQRQLPFPQRVLDITPRTDALPGLVLHQFGIDHIDALERSGEEDTQLREYNELLRTYHPEIYPHGIYTSIRSGNTASQLQDFPELSYDLIIGFNAHAHSMSRNQEALHSLLKENGHLLLTMPVIDQEKLTINSRFQTIVDGPLEAMIRSIGDPTTVNDGVKKDRFGFYLSQDHQQLDSADGHVTLLKKCGSVNK